MTHITSGLRTRALQYMIPTDTSTADHISEKLAW
jgi:hypothetical protein